MGCVSSNLLNHEDEFTQLGSAAFNHHIVKLTSTTYGLLSLDPPSPPPPPQTPTTPPLPPPRFTLSEQPEVIHWPDTTDSFRFSTPQSHNKENHTTKSKTQNSGPISTQKAGSKSEECPRPYYKGARDPDHKSRVLKPKNGVGDVSILEGYSRLCPPNGEGNRVVIYTTTLRGIRKTFEACNVVRSAMEGFNVAICERDVSMDRGFREELRELMKGRERDDTVPPRVFVKGRYIGGAEEVIRLVDEGLFGKLVAGLEGRKKTMCEGCGDVKFLPCFKCNGSCKLVIEGSDGRGRCPDCNENGLVLCPICS